jgi:hypothetical protein
VITEVDHIVPVARGGETTLDNLCLTCESCNRFKRDYQTAFDPETGEVVGLFHPRIQNWFEHFAWSDDYLTIVGLTDIGRATVSQFKMNRKRVIRARTIWLLAGWTPDPPTDISPE